ncbi:MAG: recombination protein RecR [Acidobacteria bacterium]|nr:recombination protein RecR [Acidobacteriota bacterium]MBI3657473.1 recombination protein RecR [Acidobacteriota bacterium]
MDTAEPITRLIEELKRLPGIGQKTAQRLTYSILRKSKTDAEQLARAILAVKEKIVYCRQCNNLTDVDPCRICANPARTNQTICVVEEAHNILSIEKIREFRGRYHVLHGVLSPINGIGPEELNLKNLFGRLEQNDVKEVVLATNPTVEGEATAIYLAKLIKPLGIKVTRIALGIPVGSSLEFADEVTLSKAMDGRREI